MQHATVLVCDHVNYFVVESHEAVLRLCYGKNVDPLALVPYGSAPDKNYYVLRYEDGKFNNVMVVYDRCLFLGYIPLAYQGDHFHGVYPCRWALDSVYEDGVDPFIVDLLRSATCGSAKLRCDSSVCKEECNKRQAISVPSDINFYDVSCFDFNPLRTKSGHVPDSFEIFFCGEYQGLEGLMESRCLHYHEYAGCDPIDYTEKSILEFIDEKCRSGTCEAPLPLVISATPCTGKSTISASYSNFYDIDECYYLKEMKKVHGPAVFEQIGVAYIVFCISKGEKRTIITSLQSSHFLEWCVDEVQMIRNVKSRIGVKPDDYDWTSDAAYCQYFDWYNSRKGRAVVCDVKSISKLTLHFNQKFTQLCEQGREDAQRPLRPNLSPQSLQRHYHSKV